MRHLRFKIHSTTFYTENCFSIVEPQIRSICFHSAFRSRTTWNSGKIFSNKFICVCVGNLECSLKTPNHWNSNETMFQVSLLSCFRFRIIVFFITILCTFTLLRFNLRKITRFSLKFLYHFIFTCYFAC